ncbi:formate dehydrogenase accessory sulfurtransferase FdhD [Cupriavidus sp. 30B13]|uniref:formate dehydrogenase accessory sulfurtransferase FdhD n=1 Tax=Cupriavidus sp. 30B13 TaxID=3384241 RepID=UPI003B908621
MVRHGPGFARPGRDRVAEEFPVALVFNGVSHAVMMTTPRDLEAFAVGFALTEGIVGAAADIFDVELAMHESGAEVQLSIAQEAFMSLKQRRRTLAGRTGCGVCGLESLELLDLVPAPLAPVPGRAVIRPEAVWRAARDMPARQPLMRETGGVHAAAWCAPDGGVLHVMEDVGRHNALDKLIGHLALRRADLRHGFVFMSSRASYELVRKAARMQIPALATISAPTSLAIGIARQAGMRLFSFCRDESLSEFAGEALAHDC